MTTSNIAPQQGSLFEAESAVDAIARSMLDQLLSDSRLYHQSQGYKDLLDFVVRLRNFAPFNAMLLQLQKPGLSYAASVRDWRERFDRHPKEGARPLLILWPFGPVALVYDLMDTDGKPLPEDTASFSATGLIDAQRMASFMPLIAKKHVVCNWFDAGDSNAGAICVVSRAVAPKEVTRYQVSINRNHVPNVQFATLAHELSHLFLGHLGSDTQLNIPQRRRLPHQEREIEAESVAYLVCKRNGVAPKSETYLAAHVSAQTKANDIDLYQVMRAAGQVETLLGLTAHTKFDRP